MSNLIRYNKSLSSLFDEFEHNINRLWKGYPLTQELDWMPVVDIAVDIKEENSTYIVKADIPGVPAKNIKTSIDHQNNLIIEGEKESECKKEEKNYVCIERSKGSFYRKISLPHMVDAENIKAKYKDGVLEIIIPKSKTGTARQINIES